ncbi:MAG: ABC transporter permease [Candidatus Hodarchaeales archaeon]|jgi:ABC-2 type transport system permease protein
MSSQIQIKLQKKQFSKSRYLKLVRRYLWMSFLSRIEYKVSFYFELLFQVVMLVISLLFWQVIFLKTNQFGNWTFEAVLVLHLYSQVFIAIFITFFMGCHMFWRSIQTGRLDIYLTRPLDARLAFLAEQIRFHGSYRLFLNLIVIGTILWWLQVQINLFHFFLTLIMIVLAALSLGLMQFTANCIAFWIIKSDAIDEFLDTVFEFYRYPLTVLPLFLQGLFTIGVPIIFAATWPALFLIGGMGLLDYLVVTGELLLVIGGWYVFLEIAWNAGLRRYESGGG